MTNLVNCCKLKKQLPRLEKPPFPGELGQKIYQQVSKQAYEEWLDLQVKILNEYRLDLGEESERHKLIDEMTKFLQLK